MLFPLTDDNPTRRRPVATYVIIGLNVVAWGLFQRFGFDPGFSESLCRYGLVPGDLLGTIEPGSKLRIAQNLICQFDGETNVVTLVSSMFMHGGWLHLIGNMWFLWVFGDNVEDSMGAFRFTLFYLLAGLVAAAAQIATDTTSVIPMVGASGAIGGVMGAYALLYPRARVRTLIFLGFFITTVSIPAVFILGWWFVVQLISGLPSLGRPGGGVAFWAHIGGFIAGVLLVTLFRQRSSNTIGGT